MTLSTTPNDKGYLIACASMCVAMTIFISTSFSTIAQLHSKHCHFVMRVTAIPTVCRYYTSSPSSLVLGNPISNSLISNGGRFFGTFARTLTLLWIIGWFIIRNSYQASLYTYLQSHKVTSNYDTIEKILASDCKVLATLNRANLLGKMMDRSRVIANDTQPIEQLKTLHDGNMDGVVFSTDVVQKAFNRKYPKRRLAFTKDRVFMFSPVFIFQRKSAMTRVFNKQIQALQEFGLIDFWTRNYISGSGKRSNKVKPSMLQLKNILAAFQICGILYLLSFTVFVFELISVRFHRIKCVLDFFTY